MDTHPTLQRKKELLVQANIPIHPNVVFAPINFNKDTFEDVLYKVGYNKNRKTLFLWEGVVYYLPLKAVEDTLRFIKLNSPAGSTVCFDYSSYWRGIEGDRLTSLKEIGDFMKANFPGEPNLWSIEEFEIESFWQIGVITSSITYKRKETIFKGNILNFVMVQLLGVCQQFWVW